MFELNSGNFREIVHAIERRAERQLFEERLAQTFVPNRVLGDLATPQNQLVFGRRGVGKTHTLKYYISNEVQQGILSHYVDCTTFGSGISTGNTSPLNVGIRFYSKILYRLSEQLLDDLVGLEEPIEVDVDRLQTLIENLVALSEPSSEDPRFDYTRIVQVTDQVLDGLNAERLVLIIDEWAQIPITAQPYVAEFLKRSLFANPRITLKISLVDYQHNLSTRIEEQLIGIEMAADIFSDIRMDSYFVWDEDQEFVESFFGQVLFNHLGLALDIDITETQSNQKLNYVLKDLFTQRNAFSEMCRASEGNTRDFLVIFGRCFVEFQKQNAHERIGLSDIQTAAAVWYRQDKQTNIAGERHLENFLAYLINDVIRAKKSRTFMVPYRDINHSTLRDLFAARILHPLNKVWSHPDRPGERYTLVSIDYGTYVSLKGTRAEPNEKLLWNTEDLKDETQLEGIGEDDFVPFDDRRSIRRIVVDKEILDRFSPDPVIGN